MLFGHWYSIPLYTKGRTWNAIMHNDVTGCPNVQQWSTEWEESLKSPRRTTAAGWCSWLRGNGGRGNRKMGAKRRERRCEWWGVSGTNEKEMQGGRREQQDKEQEGEGREENEEAELHCKKISILSHLLVTYSVLKSYFFLFCFVGFGIGKIGIILSNCQIFYLFWRKTRF